MKECVVAAFYHFTDLGNYQEMKPSLLDFCKEQSIKGTILLANEGINGTVSGSREAIDLLFSFLKKDPRLAPLTHKESYLPENSRPFYRMKVKLKKEIVTLGEKNVRPHDKTGHLVSPEDWNKLIEDPEVILIDTRNDYEVEIGTFKHAIDPKTVCFRDFPEYIRKTLDPKKHKKVAMFCTGGIRCEKASSFMLNEGFEEVYQLNGGILKYLETVPQENSSWLGECFVFDNRVAVDHNLQPGQYDQCHACRHPINEEDKKSEAFQLGVSCPHCAEKTSKEDQARFAERQKQIMLAKHRGETPHIGRSYAHHASPPSKQ